MTPMIDGQKVYWARGRHAHESDGPQTGGWTPGWPRSCPVTLWKLRKIDKSQADGIVHYFIHCQITGCVAVKSLPRCQQHGIGHLKEYRSWALVTKNDTIGQTRFNIWMAGGQAYSRSGWSWVVIWTCLSIVYVYIYAYKYFHFHIDSQLNLKWTKRAKTIVFVWPQSLLLYVDL